MSPERTGNHLRHREEPAGRVKRRVQHSRKTPPPASLQRSKPLPKPIETFHKCSSEPLIFSVPIAGGDELIGSPRSSDSKEGRLIFRLHTFNDLFSYSPEQPGSPLSRFNGGYEKEAKVVITVTVEGSPGPLRALVKLGSSVEDTIKLVIQKYKEEGRTPRLDNHDDASSFDLHQSYFSLQCLERTNAIGEIGSRSFYLRKGNKKSQEENSMEVATTSLPTSDFVCVRGSPLKQHSSPMVIFHSFVTQKINKLDRRTRKLFKILGCLHST